MRKALFWDFDGTIIHGNTSFFDGLCMALDRFQYDVPSERIRECLLTTCSWYIPEIEYTGKTGRLWWGLPEDCYMIGDNPVADIQGGSAVGMKTILVHYEGVYTSGYKCSNLSEILMLLVK